MVTSAHIVKILPISLKRFYDYSRGGGLFDLTFKLHNYFKCYAVVMPILVI